MSRFDQIPRELRERDQWITWRREQRHGRSTKVPYNAENGELARTTDRRTWTTFDRALAARASFDGLGFVFAPEDGLVGIDLDDCMLDSGEPHEEAARIVLRLDSYTERSPSDGGLHVVLQARLNSRRNRTPKTPWGGNFEVYDRDRFFTMTGNGSGEINERQNELDTILAKFLPPRRPRQLAAASGPIEVDDRVLIERARAAWNGQKFDQLWRGQWKGIYSSQSEADLALCSMLAFWTGRDRIRIDRLFRASALMRPKWERLGYRERTIAAATSDSPNPYVVPYSNVSPQVSAASAVRDNDRSAAEQNDASSVITRARDVRSRRVQWAWQAYVPLGYLTIQSGETKLGKSTFFAYLAAQVTQGRLPGQFQGQPAAVLILATEDSRDDLWKPRLDAAGADLDLVAFLDVPDGWNVRDGVSVIARGLDELPGPVVFVDAVMEHLPETRGSDTANSATFVRQSFRPFANLCRKRHVAGVISTHPPKSRADGFTGAYHGSGAFTQLSRSCLLFGWHPDDRALPEEYRRHVILRAAANIGRDPGALSFRIGGRTVDLDDGTQDEIGCVSDVEPCSITARDLLNADRSISGDDAPRVSKIDQVCERIRGYLADGEWHPALRPALEAEGFSGGTIHDACKRVGIGITKDGMDGGWRWRLGSSETPDSSTDRRPLSRARSNSTQPDSSTLQDEAPASTQEPKSQTSSTNGVMALDVPHRRAKESGSATHSLHATERTVADLTEAELLDLFPGSQIERIPAGVAA